ncbi:MAG: argininosuccinate lyase [Actinomycetota bacterium]
MTPLWSGRFAKTPSDAQSALSVSLSYDQRLWREEIDVCRAHAAELERSGLLEPSGNLAISEALDQAAAQLEEGTFFFAASDEDIHSAVERFLIETLGDVGARIHAGRSRNDLVVTDLRLWLKQATRRIARGVYDLQEALYRIARDHEATLMPGYTHLQRAQPTVLSHHMMAHAFGLGRDFERVIAAYRRCDVSPLGAAAFGGTSLPLDARATASALGFGKVFDNSADAVADRDFALEFLAATAILSVRLSSIGEELVLWTSKEFGFATLDDAFATGSSIMPQKKNPDVGELSRAKSARVTSNLVRLLGVLKGLPLTYNRDLQEDKEVVFDTADTVDAVLGALKGAMQTISFHIDVMQAACSEDAGAAGIAEALVLKGTPFRQAHELVGKLVAAAEVQGIKISQMDLSEYAPIDAGDLRLLDPRIGVEARSSHGATSADRIKEQFARLETLMDDEERWLAGFGAY